MQDNELAELIDTTDPGTLTQRWRRYYFAHVASLTDTSPGTGPALVLEHAEAKALKLTLIAMDDAGEFEKEWWQ